MALETAYGNADLGDVIGGDATDDLPRAVKLWQARQESKGLSKVTIGGLASKFDASDAGGKITFAHRDNSSLSSDVS